MSQINNGGGQGHNTLDFWKVVVWLGVVAFGVAFWFVVVPAIIGAIQALQHFAVPGAY